MRFFEALASAFFKTFGITEPDDKTRRRAVWFFFGLVTLALAGIAALSAVAYRVMH